MDDEGDYLMDDEGDYENEGDERGGDEKGRNESGAIDMEEYSYTPSALSHTSHPPPSPSPLRCDVYTSFRCYNCKKKCTVNSQKNIRCSICGYRILLKLRTTDHITYKTE